MYTLRPARKSDKALLYISVFLSLALVSAPGLLFLLRLSAQADEALTLAIRLSILVPITLAVAGIYSVVVLIRIDSLSFTDLFASRPLENDFRSPSLTSK